MKLPIDIPEEMYEKDKEIERGFKMSKEKLLELLAKEDELTLTWAYLYAKNLTNYSVDISKRWTTAIETATALERAYKKGYYDALRR